MKTPNFLIAIICIALFSACENDTPKTKLITSEKEQTIKGNDDRVILEKAHKKSAFLSNQAIRFKINLSFGGKERLAGKMTLATNSTAGKIEYKNGNVLLYNKEGIFHSDSMGSDSKLRFAAYTWSYFFLLPYKLSDPGTNWRPLNLPSLGDSKQSVYNLSFNAGIGDAPDDWYKIYANQKSNLVEAASYIVTANKTKEEAEKDPHAIQYLNYKLVSGVPIAHKWAFWAWRADSGLTKQLGNTQIENVEFIAIKNDFFHSDSSLIQLPSN